MFNCFYLVTLLWVGMAAARWKYDRDVKQGPTQPGSQTGKTTEKQATDIHADMHEDKKFFVHAFELMTNANHYLTAKMLTEAATQNSGSFVISASSAFHPLSLFTLAAEGETRRELLKVLKFHDENDPDNDNNLIRAANSVANGILSIAKGIEVLTGNRIYIANYMMINGNFLDLDSHGLGTEVVLFESSNGAQTVTAINSWVAIQTNNKMADFLGPRDIDINTQAIIVDALYFMGQWRYPFNNKQSYLESFYATDTNGAETESSVVSEITYMSQVNTFGFNNAEDMDAQILELPYLDPTTNASFVIILPNSQTGLGNVLRKMSDPEILSNALRGIHQQTVDVAIPQFKIETKTDLKEIFQKIGVVSLFDSTAELPHLLKDSSMNNFMRFKERNDRKKIAPDPKKRYARSSHLLVSKALQKACISVYEGGTEQTRGNTFHRANEPVPVSNGKKFKADHAFVFLIKHHDIILFSGVFNPFKGRRSEFDDI